MYIFSCSFSRAFAWANWLEFVFVLSLFTLSPHSVEWTFLSFASSIYLFCLLFRSMCHMKGLWKTTVFCCFQWFLLFLNLCNAWDRTERSNHLISFIQQRKIHLTQFSMERNKLMVMIDQCMVWRKEITKWKRSECNVQQEHMDRCITRKSATRNKCNIRLFYSRSLSVHLSSFHSLSPYVCKWVYFIYNTVAYWLDRYTVHTRNITALQIIRSINSK